MRRVAVVAAASEAHHAQSSKIQTRNVLCPVGHFFVRYGDQPDQPISTFIHHLLSSALLRRAGSANSPFPFFQKTNEALKKTFSFFFLLIFFSIGM